MKMHQKTFWLALLFVWCAFGVLETTDAYANETQPTYKVYANDKFGYSIEYPDIFWSRFEADSGDGVRLKTANGQCELAVWGAFNVLSETAKTRLQSRLEESAHIVPKKTASGKDWYTLTTSDDGGLNGVEHYFFEYGRITPDNIAVVTFSYPLHQGFEAVVEHLKKSLQLGAVPGEALQQFNLYDWTPEYTLNLEDEKIYHLNGDTKSCAGDARTAASDMGAYYWFPIAPAADTQARETDWGVYFFSEAGKCIAFLPTQAAEFVKNIYINSTAKQMLIDFGPSPEQTVTLYNFETLRPERTFPAMEKISWVDADHFAMTYLETKQKPRVANEQRKDWLSVVIFDARTGQMKYLRKATETSNFLLDAVDTQKKTFTIGERWVKNKRDWANDEKIAGRELTISY